MLCGPCHYLFEYESLYLKESLYRYAIGIDPFDRRMNVSVLLTWPLLFLLLVLLRSRKRSLIGALSIVTMPSASTLFFVEWMEHKKWIGITYGLACFDKMYLVGLLPILLMNVNNKVHFLLAMVTTWSCLVVLSSYLHGISITQLFIVTYKEQLNPDFHPNLGIWWYINQQMFDQYRVMYLGVLWAHMFVYQYPLMRMLKDKVLSVWLNMIIVLLFSPNPSFFQLLYLWSFFERFQQYHKCLIC